MKKFFVLSVLMVVFSTIFMGCNIFNKDDEEDDPPPPPPTTYYVVSKEYYWSSAELTSINTYVAEHPALSSGTASTAEVNAASVFLAGISGAGSVINTAASQTQFNNLLAAFPPGDRATYSAQMNKSGNCIIVAADVWFYVAKN
ncbi:hypothetical protein AGMMS49940_15710 [Spirochaetia bacterium]|nr:hypothetical protein AGMMS49940_15710 [Spirochaetia bacterium]